MPSSSTGKWVSRAGATGGNRVYRSRTPVNWYLGVLIVVILGLVSIGWARYDRQHSSSSSSAQHTAVNVGVAFFACGTQEPALPASSKSSSGVTTTGNGVVTFSGAKAASPTLGDLAHGFPHLVLTASTLRFPGKSLLRNGERCPAGTPEAGKVGQVRVVHWANFSVTHGSEVTGDPLGLPLKSGELVTVAFAPRSVTLAQPPTSTRDALLQAIANTSSSSAPTTTTTSPTSTPGSTASTPTSSTATTTPSTTTSSAPATTTTTIKR